MLADSATPVTGDRTTQADNYSDYGDFGSDAEEVEILDELLTQIATQREEVDVPLLVTDIEDYEPPRGLFLPKVLGVEIQSAHVESPVKIVVLRDSQTSNSKSWMAHASWLLTC